MSTLGSLPSDAFLRNMPRCLDLADRLRLEAIITSVDIIDLAFGRLVEKLTAISGKNQRPVDDKTRIEVSIHCWTIIDNLHNFLQFTKKLINTPDDKLAVFANLAKDATLLRNSMDHFSTNLQNSAQKKGVSHPVYGAILFAAAADIYRKIRYISFPLGALHHAPQVSPVIDTHLVPPSAGIGHISFAAFDRQISFSTIVPALFLLIEDLDSQVKHSVTAQVQEAAAKDGLDADALLSQKVSGSMIFTLQFLPEDLETPPSLDDSSATTP